MNSEDKADELKNKYRRFLNYTQLDIEVRPKYLNKVTGCAVIAVNEIIKNAKYSTFATREVNFWFEVKEHLTNPTS